LILGEDRKTEFQVVGLASKKSMEKKILKKKEHGPKIHSNPILPSKNPVD
jgi:hypothetical protein